MRRTFLVPHRKRKGVSEVLGALLLIVVVVATVASLSVFLAQAQTNAQARQTYLTSVANENLQIAYAQFYPNNPAIQWELDAPSGTTDAIYYVQMTATPTIVSVTQVGTPTVSGTPAASYTITLPSGSFNSIAKGAHATVMTAGLTQAITSISFSPVGTWTFNPAIWTNVTVTVRNLNTAASGIYQVKVNNNWLGHWEQVSQDGKILLGTGTPTSPALQVPAKSSITLNLTVSAFGITKEDPLAITVLSSAGNFFTGSYSPPVPIAKVSTSSQNYQVTMRDVVTFDASQSFSSGSTIQNYFWQIDVPLVPLVGGNPEPSLCNSTAFAKPSEFSSIYVSGQTIEYTPESLFTSAQLTADCITGPIRATLIVVDGNGLMTTSNPLVIPLDQNIAPIGALSASKMNFAGNENSTVTVQVNDIFGRPVVGAVVLLVKTSGTVTGFDPVANAATTLPSSVETGAGGTVSFDVAWPTGGGSIELELGNLPPVQLSFP